MKADNMDRERLRELFRYKNGDLIRIADKNYKDKVCDITENTDFNRYKRIRTDGARYYTHRLVFLYHHGYFPKYIDHINGNKADNRIENLRGCTRSENYCNQGVCARNTSGYKNVSFHKHTGLWVARIQKNKKSHLIGYFNSPQDADVEVKKAREKLHGEFCNHG